MTEIRPAIFLSGSRQQVVCRVFIASAVLLIWLSTSVSAQQFLYLNYNESARIALASPSDICLENGEDEHCMLIQRHDGSAWPGLEFPVEEVSIPTAENASLVAGRHGDDFGWFVYDFTVEDYIVSPVEIEEALDVYNIMGLDHPDFVDARNARAVLGVAQKSDRTFANIVLGVLGVLTVIALFLFVLVALSLWLLGTRFSLRHREAMRRALWALAIIAACAWILLLLGLLLWSGS